MTHLLEVRDLSRAFGAVRALSSVNLHVTEGEILGIIGPNGCGKTTLFNCVSGRFPPTKGRIYWLGNDITGLSLYKVARRGLVRTFQETRVFPSGTARSNVEMAHAISSGAVPSGSTLLPDDVDELLALAGLTEVAHASVTALPFGHLRRLGIAIALSAHPRLLLLDEPAAGLNDAEGADLASLLRRLHERGLTLAIVDHDMDFLLPLAQRVVVLASGEKLREGTPDEIRSDPAVIEVYLGKIGARLQDLAVGDVASEERTHGG